MVELVSEGNGLWGQNLSEWEPGLEIVFLSGGRHRRRDLGGRVSFHSWELQIYPCRSHLLRNGGSRALSGQARFWDGGQRGGRLFLLTTKKAQDPRGKSDSREQWKLKVTEQISAGGECGAGGGEGD